MNQGGAIKKEGDMEQAIVMEITLSSSDLYEDALAALAKLEEEAARLKALTAAARLPTVWSGVSGRTEHVTRDQLLAWLAKAEPGKALVYAVSATWFAKDAATEGNHGLMLLANKIHDLAQDGQILLTQSTGAPVTDTKRVFEYRATKASSGRRPAWRPDWLG
jgi:hypothetical protein